jgi:hypothetical protein
MAPLQPHGGTMKYHLVHTLKIPAADYYKVITSPEYDQWSKEKLKM